MTDKQSARIAFIGAGNMATALVGGMLARGFTPDRVTLTDISTERLDMLARQYGVKVTTDNAAAAADADVILFAVKPQQMAEVCGALAPVVRARKPHSPMW